MRKNFFINIRKVWLILLNIGLNNNKKYICMFIIKKLAFEKKKNFAEKCAKCVLFFDIHYNRPWKIIYCSTMFCCGMQQDKFCICSDKLASSRKKVVLFLRYLKWKPYSKLNIFLHIFKIWFEHRIFGIFEKYTWNQLRLVLTVR